jgi:hypothetical protein
MKKLLVFIARKPKTFLFVSCLIFLVISCYPVIFFNKSFVSPSNISQLSDSSGEIVPGYLNEVNGSYIGADRGAMLWGVAPNLKVAADSIMKFHEFPWWNRFVGGGTALYSQTNNLVLDPTNIFFYFLGSNSLSYDLKFLLSRLIFSIGIGFLGFKVSKNILASTIVSVSSLFIGYYQYRFNHPALFVITYIPMLLLCWLKMPLTFYDNSKASKIIATLTLTFVSFLQLNSGPIKETLPSAFFVHMVGLLNFIFYFQKKDQIKRGLMSLSIILPSLFLTASFYCFLFLDFLKKSFTVYDSPVVVQLPIYSILGFFQNSFNINGIGFSSNLFFLFCTSIFFSLGLYKPNKKSERISKLLLLFSIILSAAVYGVIPNYLLIKIPYFNNIHHIFDVLSTPLFVFLSVIAVLAIDTYLSISTRLQIKHFRIFLFIYIFFYSIFVIYSGKAKLVPFLWTLILLLFVYFSLIRLTKFKYYIFAIFFIGTNFTNAQHLSTGIKTVDKYLIRPTGRADYSIESKSISFIKSYISKNAPIRIVGLNEYLFPGYNARVGLESLVSVEPLRNSDFEKLMDFSNFNYANDWHWLRLLTHENLLKVDKGFNLMNVGLILTRKDVHLPKNYKLIHESDYRVWERPNVWPRAYFTNLIIPIDTQGDLQRYINKLGNNYSASINLDDYSRLGLHNTYNLNVLNASAFNYQLTNNSTIFDINVPSSGFVVLSENFSPKDFEVYVNGTKVDYYKVNSSFKGVYITDPGLKHIEFVYRPEYLNVLLKFLIVGFILPFFFIL